MFLADGLLGSAAADSVAIAQALGSTVDSFLPGLAPQAKALILGAGTAILFHWFEKMVNGILNGGYKSNFTAVWAKYSPLINPVLVLLLGYFLGNSIHLNPVISGVLGMVAAGIRATFKTATAKLAPSASSSTLASPSSGAAQAGPAVTAVLMLGLLGLPAFERAKLHYDVGAALHSERLSAADQYSTRYTLGAHYALTNHIVPKVQYFKPFGKDKHAGGEASINVTF